MWLTEVLEYVAVCIIRACVAEAILVRTVLLFNRILLLSVLGLVICL